MTNPGKRMVNVVKYALAVLFLLPLAATAQTGEKNQLDAAGEKHGPWESNYQYGKLRYTGQFEHGKPIGTFTYYTPKGNLESTMVFSEDGSQARTVVYYTDKKEVMARGNYLNQERDSIWTFYSNNGYISSKEGYKAGKKDGFTVVYYFNGKVAREIMFKDGVEEGPTKEFFDDGKRKMEGTYANGRLEGRVSRWHPNGFIYAQGTYVDGRRHGNWIFYDEKGKVAKRKRFYRGQDATKPPPKKKEMGEDGPPDESGQ